MGEFASHDYGYGGYALLGKSIGVESYWNVNDNFGIGADISFKDFRFASGYYLLDYIAAEPAFASLDMLSTNYKLKSFLLGAYISKHITNKLTISYKLLGGCIVSRTPDQLFTAEAFSVGKTYFWKTSARSITPAVQTGLNIDFSLYEHISFYLQCDFSYTRASYTFIRSNDKYIDLLHIPLLQLSPGISIHW